MLQFLRKTKFNNLPLEFCKSMQKLWSTSKKTSSRSFPSTSCRDGLLKLQLHDAIYRLRFYSNSLIHILSLSNSHNNVASIQKNRGDKSRRVIVALQGCLGMSPKLATAQLPTVPQPCFQRWRLKSTGQVSPV